jgi:hypothetical protein
MPHHCIHCPIIAFLASSLPSYQRISKSLTFISPSMHSVFHNCIHCTIIACISKNFKESNILLKNSHCIIIAPSLNSLPYHCIQCLMIALIIPSLHSLHHHCLYIAKFPGVTFALKSRRSTYKNCCEKKKKLKYPKIPKNLRKSHKSQKIP